MEGRAIARPNRDGTLTCGPGITASMEGRAIARPNGDKDRLGTRQALTLQWRAGQLPGQTTQHVVGDRHRGTASMEGRAIARPNLS